MKVYIVRQMCDDSDDAILGTFATEKEAKDYFNKYGDHEYISIDECDTEDTPESVIDRSIHNDNGEILYECYCNVTDNTSKLTHVTVDRYCDIDDEKAIDVLRANYHEPYVVKDLVNTSGFSVPAGLRVDGYTQYMAVTYATDRTKARAKFRDMVKQHLNLKK